MGCAFAPQRSTRSLRRLAVAAATVLTTTIPYDLRVCSAFMLHPSTCSQGVWGVAGSPGEAAAANCGQLKRSSTTRQARRGVHRAVGVLSMKKSSAADGEAAARASLIELRTQGDNPGSTVESGLTTLVDGLAAAEGTELLITEASVILQRCPRLAEAAETGTLSAAIAASNASTSGAEYLADHLQSEIVAELHTPWPVAVKKWRQKALAVEKYRSTNPTANAAVYTYMVNCCLRQGMWEVAYDALTYAGLMTAGPFFVSQQDLGLGSPSVVFDVDKLACYIAENILDMDLDVWRRRGGDTSVPDTAGNNRPGVGVEERNFSQDDDSVTHLAALRVQDMTLAAARVALRKIRANFQESGDLPADATLVILCSATPNVLFLGELLLPRRAMCTLLALDFAEAVEIDPGMAAPLVISGNALKSWVAQKDYARVEVANET